MSRILTFHAKETDAGRPVRDILKGTFHLVSHDLARAKYRTEHGITVNGEDVLVNRLLKAGDVLCVRLDPELPEKTVPTEGPLSILYEDPDVICLNKPAGLVVHPSHGHFADTLGNYLAYYFLSTGEPHEIRTVGRLDKDTSGAILFGKSRTACAILAGQIPGEKALQMTKTYLALAEGVFPEHMGVVDAPISREYEEKIRRVVRPDGDPAHTEYEVLKQYDGYALLQVRITTGRTHQIRVHMAHLGHPLLGDPIYGHAQEAAPTIPLSTEPVPLLRAALHAHRLSFLSPFTKEPISLTAPLPADMQAYL